MEREQEMLHSLFEFATEGIIICDQQGVIRLVNPAAEKIFGYTRGELNDKKIEVLLLRRYHEKHVGSREGYVKSPEPRSMGRGRDLYGLRKDGSEIMVEVSLSPFETQQGKFVMSFMVDVSERKKNENELRLAHERLQQTTDALSVLNAELETKVKERTEELAVAIDKLASSKSEVMRALERERQVNEMKSRFITTASHEFRTPLGTILSSVSLIGRYEATEDADKRRKHIERIKSSVTNLTEILNDFLSIEKLEEGITRNKPESINLHSLLKEICDDMRSIARPGQTISLEYSGVESVNLDPQLVKNAVMNLLSNAIKYSPENKPIVIRVSEQGKILRIDIIDSGIGIPEKDLPHVFERFYRASNSGNVQGTGLGLNIVKKYVELMNGNISCTSVEGEGTTFTIELI
jgi:PAS domain S-box-containing protein